MSYNFSRPLHSVSVADKGNIMANASADYRQAILNRPDLSKEQKKMLRSFYLKNAWSRYHQMQGDRHPEFAISREWNPRRERYENRVPSDDISKTKRVKAHCKPSFMQFKNDCENECRIKCASKNVRRGKACEKSGWPVGTDDVEDYMDTRRNAARERFITNIRGASTAAEKKEKAIRTLQELRRRGTRYPARVPFAEDYGTSSVGMLSTYDPDMTLEEIKDQIRMDAPHRGRYGYRTDDLINLT